MEDKERAPLAPVSFDEFPPVTYEQWKEEATVSLKGAPFEKKLLTKTYEGLTLQPIYTAEMAQEAEGRLSFPGAADYLRGVQAAGYLDKPWAIAQGTDVADPQEANAILKEELARGANAISFDAGGSLRFQSVQDAIDLFSGVCLCSNQLNIYAGASALPALGLLKASAEKLGKGTEQYSGCVGADPIGAYAKQGQLPGSLECLYKQMGAALRFARKEMPQVKTIFINASVYHNGGANAVQEVAAAMATAAAYLDALTEQGFSVDEIASSIRFGFSLGADFFMQIAKLRAARMVWAQLVKAYGGSAEAAKIDIAACTSAFTKTVYDPYVNILRMTTQTFSGVVGGVSELTVTPFDSAIRPADEQSRRIARNIQVMMAEEFGLLSPVDPAGGSWYVETLTAQLAEAVWTEMQKLDAEGGIAAALQAGSLQAEIGQVLAQRFRNLATRADRAVGSNMYPNMSEQPLAQPAAKPAAPAQVGQAPEHIDHCVQAVAAAYAVGALYDQVAVALCCGASPAIAPIAAHRWTEQIEALRQATEKAAAAGKEIKVFLCNMGPIPQHKARADFSAGFMEVAGFRVLRNDGFATTDEAIAAAQASGAEVAVICSTDDTYPELVPVLAQGLKAAVPGMTVLLAGAPPKELKPEWDAAGVNDYIHVKADCLSILTAIQNERGIR